MKNKQKASNIYKTRITSDDITPLSSEPVGNAYDNPSCVYDHQWHAEGSQFESKSGVKMVCGADGEWKNIQNAKLRENEKADT